VATEPVKENIKAIYDIHCHAMNLSHPNLMAYFDRFKMDFKIMGPVHEAQKNNMTGKFKRMLNLLSMMENELGDFFLIWEYYLKIDKELVNKKNKFTVLNQEFDKLILTPLVVDFGKKDWNSFDVFYKVPPSKPVEEQIVDLFNGIAKYSKNDINITDTGAIVYKDSEKENKLFEIYPFYGINPNLIELSEVKDNMNRFFGNFDGQRENLFKNMGNFDGNFKSLGDFSFSGLKIYPPLGVDPYPLESAPAMKKMEFIYDFCVKKNIPVTVHCSDTGYVTVKNAKTITHPNRWEKVLNDFPELKLNLAHFGYQRPGIIFGSTVWNRKVINLCQRFKNVYSDISCLGFTKKFYKEFALTMRENPHLFEKMMFGSDFMINLSWTESYNEYLKLYTQTDRLQDRIKEQMMVHNPEKFLWNKV